MLRPRQLALLVCVPILAEAKMLLQPVALKGFNSFDSYPAKDLNDSSVAALADALAADLLPHGYDHLVIDGGWTSSYGKYANGSAFIKQNLDEFARPIPAPERYADMAALAATLKRKGLKLGLWTIRGVHKDAVAKKLRIKGTNYTVDQIVDQHAFADGSAGDGIHSGRNLSCLWAPDWLGVNKSHPATQAYYDSRVELLASYGVSFIKADCMMCQPCYSDEIVMFSSAVAKQDATLALSYSPGGGNSPENGSWVANHELATMYRIVTDFHGGWTPLQQNIFAAGNFSVAGLFGKMGSYADLDMLPMGNGWWGRSTEQDDRGQTIATLYMVTGAPLMHSGKLPVDPQTLAYLTNADALSLHAHGRVTKVVYEGNCTCVEDHHHYNPSLIVPGTCTIPTPSVGPPCIASWVSEVKVAGSTGGGWYALVLMNMGEVNVTVHSDLGRLLQPRPDEPEPQPQMETETVFDTTNLWTKAHVGSFASSAVLTTEGLRPHASVLYKLTARSGDDGDGGHGL